jgi:hypothetical protein
MMTENELKDYFRKTAGTGVLSTADRAGEVNSAIYARPHVLEEGVVAFITRENLTWSNLQSNPYASYLFMQKYGSYEGVRLQLTKVEETSDPDLIEAIVGRRYPDDGRVERHLMQFKVGAIRPLVGNNSEEG